MSSLIDLLTTIVEKDKTIEDFEENNGSLINVYNDYGKAEFILGYNNIDRFTMFENDHNGNPLNSEYFDQQRAFSIKQDSTGHEIFIGVNNDNEIVVDLNLGHPDEDPSVFNTPEQAAEFIEYNVDNDDDYSSSDVDMDEY